MNFYIYLVFTLKASVLFRMHLLHMISETDDTDWFHSISHYWGNQDDMSIYKMMIYFRNCFHCYTTTEVQKDIFGRDKAQED